MRKGTIAMFSAIGTAAMLAGSAVLPATANAGSGVRTVTVMMNPHSIKMPSGSTVSAGRVEFHVVAPSGDHPLQLLKLKPGYTKKQAKHDINAAFSGNVKAVRRVDKKIQWFGGVDAHPHGDGWFVETLYAGNYVLTDQNSNNTATLHVVGTPSGADPWVANNSTITVVKGNRFQTKATLPRSGFALFHDTTDEPHFVVMQHVKQSTTKKDVRDYIKSGGQGHPSWGLPESTSSGVVSGGDQFLFHYRLKKGKYLLMCFWPDDETGMPHFFMGMWKLVELK